MSLGSIIEGLKIFDKHNGSLSITYYEIHAGQPEGTKLTKKEVLTLFNNEWSNNNCGGCAEEDDKKSDTFTDPDFEEDDVDEPAPVHRYTCNEWSIFV